MLYILGGAPRSGKTTLSRRILREKLIPYFPIDSLVGALKEGAGSPYVNHEVPFIPKAENLWPLTKHLFAYFIWNEDAYLVEGDPILPKQVKELEDDGKKVRACFLGFTKISPLEKLQMLRKYGKGKKDWTNDIADDPLTYVLGKMIEFSQYLEKECAKFGYKYIDVSDDFLGGHDEAFKYLTS